MQNEHGFPDQIRLSRGLKLWRATSRGMGVIVAGIVFVLLGEAVTAVGPLTPVAILLTILLVVINILGYVELAASVPRPGGAYTLVHESAGGGALAFFTGWTLALAGLGLCGLLAQGAAHHLGLFLADLIGLEVPVGLLGMGLIVLVALESGLGGRRRRRWPVVFPMVIVLLTLALLAAPRLLDPDYGQVVPQPGPAVALLMAAFTGLEIITGHQGEIRRRAVNLPRALLGALALAAAVGAVLAAVVGPQAVVVTGAPLSPLGEAVAGATGRAVVLVLGTVVLTLFLGRALEMVVRHLYVMSRDGFWPAWLRQAHPRRGVPVRLIFLAGFLGLPMVWVPVEALSRVGGLLYLSVLMIVNLALVRRPRQTAPSHFALPFHPWVPALTLAVDLLVVSLWGLGAVAWTVGCLAVGGLVYLVYGRRRYIQAQEGITVFRPPTDERAPEAFRVLVPIANPATAGMLLRIAAQLAQAQGGDVLALQVVVVPEPVPLEAGRRPAQAGRALLEQALALANEENLPVQTMTRVARSVSQGILDTAADEGADLILVGWQAPARPRAASLGPIMDGVLRGAPCDVLIVQGSGAISPKRILISTAGGPHARAAARLAISLAEVYGAEVTFLGVQPGPATPQQMEENRRRVAETLEGLSPEHLLEQKVTLAPSVVEGIVKEAQEYDLVLLGVSEETLLDRLVFGSVPLQVAARVPHTILVQAYRGLTGIWTRRVTRSLLDVLPALGSEGQWEVRQGLSRGARPGTDYFVMIVLSCIIAALGLLQDSPTVVIGAMLVAPLWSPILAFSLGLVLGDLRLIRFSSEAIFKGVALAVVIAAFIGLLSPLKTVTAEMLAQARPSLLDLAVALFAGAAGTYAVARKDVSAALPGVAIAATLMPSLTTAGLSLSMGDARVAGGAFLLFVTNISAIGLAGGLVFLILGIRPQTWGPESRRRLQQRLIASLLLLLAIAIPLGIVMSRVVRETAQEQKAQEILAQYVAAEDGRLVTLEVEHRKTGLLIVATVQSTQTVDQETVEDLEAALSRHMGYRVQLDMVVLPVVRAWEE